MAGGMESTRGRRSGGRRSSHGADVTSRHRGPHDDKRADEHSVKDVLEIKVAADTTAFLVNGTEVARVPTTEIDTDGIVGLRVNHQLNIHVSSLDVVR